MHAAAAAHLLEHEVGCVNGDGSSGAVLLGLIDASEVDAHASAVHGLDLRGRVGEVRWRRASGGGNGEERRCAIITHLDSLGLVASGAGVESFEVLLAATTHDDDLEDVLHVGRERGAWICTSSALWTGKDLGKPAAGVENK